MKKNTMLQINRNLKNRKYNEPISIIILFSIKFDHYIINIIKIIKINILNQNQIFQKKNL